MDQSFHERFELPLSVDETRRRLSIESTTRFFEASIQRKQVGSNRRMDRAISCPARHFGLGREHHGRVPGVALETSERQSPPEASRERRLAVVLGQHIVAVPRSAGSRKARRSERRRRRPPAPAEHSGRSEPRAHTAPVRGVTARIGRFAVRYSNNLLGMTASPFASNSRPSASASAPSISSRPTAGSVCTVHPVAASRGTHDSSSRWSSRSRAPSSRIRPPAPPGLTWRKGSSIVPTCCVRREPLKRPACNRVSSPGTDEEEGSGMAVRG